MGAEERKVSDIGAEARDGLLFFLSSTPLFRGLDPQALNGLIDEVSYHRLLAGQLLFREGDPGDSLYIVKSGWLRVFVGGEAAGPPEVISELGRGEFVGEMALLTGDPRSASVGAVRDTELVRLSRSGFERLIELYPSTMLQMLRELAQRLQRGLHHRARAAAFRTIAIIPVGETPAPDAFIGEFASRLGGFGRVAMVTRRDAVECVGDQTPEAERFNYSDGAVGVWLDRLERENRFVVYVGGEAPDPWTRCCVRQADRILYVARSDADAAASGVAELVRARSEVLGPPRRDLALLHEDDSPPERTERWLSHVPADLHHHVRRGRPADVDRLVRILVGKASGLVLSGGGARGFAHLGVIRALEELGVPVDVVGGTSIGAVIAGLMAMGLDAREIHARVFDALTPPERLNDYTLPVYSLMRCRAIERRLSDAFQARRIEDLWLAYFCVSTDMTDVAMRVHREGLLSHAVRASIAVPGLYPPAIENGHVLIDGAVMNNLPAGVMRDLFGGRIVGVDVGAGHLQAVPKDVREFPSPYAALLNRLMFRRRRLARFPNIFQTIMGSVVTGNVYLQELSGTKVDFMLRPDLPGYKLTDWRLAREIADRSYIWAKPSIELWLNAGRGSAGDGALQATAPP